MIWDNLVDGATAASHKAQHAFVNKLRALKVILAGGMQVFSKLQSGRTPTLPEIIKGIADIQGLVRQ